MLTRMLSAFQCTFVSCYTVHGFDSTNMATAKSSEMEEKIILLWERF
jgi:hypothetical protein